MMRRLLSKNMHDRSGDQTTCPACAEPGSRSIRRCRPYWTLNRRRKVTCYVARPGKGRAPQAVLISPIPPPFMNPDKNPDGVPKEVVDKIRNGILQRMLFYKKTHDYPH
jgi:hypothetical protein